MDLGRVSLIRFNTNKTVFGITTAQMTPNHLLSKGTKKIHTVHQGGLQDIIPGILGYDTGGPIIAS